MKKQFISFLIVLFFLQGCTSTRVIDEQMNNSTNAIEVALSELGQQSADWQQVLRDLMGKVDEALKVDIQNILDRGIASLGEQANCLVDIRIQQIKRELQNLLARITGGSPQNITPIICSVSPPSIQMAFLLADPSYSRTIHFSGYDLDKGQYRIYLEKTEFDGRLLRINTVRRSISVSHLSIQTHYHAVFDYSNITLDVSCRKFLIYHGDQLLSQINIEQKTCTRQDVTKPKQTVDVTDFNKDHGDKDFGDKNAEFKVKITLSITEDRQKIKARIEVDVKEVGDILFENQRTKAHRNRTVTLFTNTQPGYNIMSITSAASFTESGFLNTSEDGNSKNYSAGDLVEKISYYGRAWGGDDLDKTKIIILFNPITVRLKETGTCIN